MGNGAKAASKRERNAKDAGNVAKSQLKSVRFFLRFAFTNALRLSPFREKVMVFHTQCTNTYIEHPCEEHKVQNLLPGFPVDGQATCAGRARQ
jgi:flagellar biosynthesis protein FlhB